jgi:hypothetical protein
MALKRINKVRFVSSGVAHVFRSFRLGGDTTARSGFSDSRH